MKALTLTQPWATLVAYNAKQFETRSWSTTHRGLLLIHSALKFPKDAKALCSQEPFSSGLVHFPPEYLSLGALLCVVKLQEIYVSTHAVAHGLVRGSEITFGNYEPGRFAWKLRWVGLLAKPIPCKGALGLWTVPPEIEAAVRSQNQELFQKPA